MSDAGQGSSPGPTPTGSSPERDGGKGGAGVEPADASVAGAAGDGGSGAGGSSGANAGANGGASGTANPSEGGVGGRERGDSGTSRDAGPFDAGPVPTDAGPPDAGLPDAALPFLPQASLDLLEAEGDPWFFRLHGSPAGNGQLGVPVASGDLDGDGFADLAMASFLASPEGRTGAGQVAVVFGSGAFRGVLDLGADPENVLFVQGAGPYEGTGSQLGIGDVNGDGQEDLLLCRQNFRAAAPDRVGAGALTIVLGGPELRALLNAGARLDLSAPPPDVVVIDVVGANALDRLGIWVRTGDLTGDGIADMAVGADQQNGSSGERDSGAVYVIRGGSHLNASMLLDLALFGSSALEGHVARIEPPASSVDYHFGATVHVGDLDRNGRSELVAAAALVRSGATYVADGAPNGSAVGSAGAPPGGRAYVVWDDNFPDAPWPPGYAIDLSAAPGSVTALLSGASDDVENERLGEELLAGGDYDGDGRPDLFVGDMIARGAGRSNTGVGFVVFDAARLRALPELTLLAPPSDVEVTTIVGGYSGGIATDTVRHGDFDGDGVLDLAVASPNASPESRVQAGTVHVLWGNTRRWPQWLDLSAPPSAAEIQITVVLGARGGSGADSGDMLAYSAEVFDVDGDGLDDLVANEMGGNGLQPGSTDVGNLLVLDGRLLSRGRPDCAGQLDGPHRFDACGVCASPGSETECVRFERDVLPILLSACPSCHGASAGLSLFSYEQLMSGASDNGPVVIPGDPDASLLVQKLFDAPPFGDRMPPPPDTGLLPEAISLIRDWVSDGARDN